MWSFFSRTGAALVFFLAACSSSDSSAPAAQDGGNPADTSTGDATAGDDASSGGDARPPPGDAGLGVSCSGAKPSFSKDVQPTLKRSCSGGEICHSGIAANPWVYAALVNAPSTRDCASAGVRVTPSSLEASYIMHKLTGVDMCPGTDRMPRGGAPLPNAQIQTIADWICTGAPNN
jgi:hypothetical protein